nr:zf-HC2 domain-containing protein [uncultured Agathobaculum sp.]
MSDEEYFEQLVSNSLDGTLTDSEREKLEEHLAECPSCAALKQDLEQMRAWFSEEGETPAGLHEGIMQKLEQETKLRVVQPEKPVRRMPVFTMVAAAAVVVLVVLGGGLMPAFSTVDSAGSANTTAASDGAAAAADTAGQAVADAAEDAGLTAGSEENAGAAVVPSEGGQAVQSRNSVPESDTVTPQDSTESTSEQSTGGSSTAATEDEVWAELQPNTKDAAGGSAEQAEAKVNIALAQAQPSLTLPDSLRGVSVAHCYFAAGGAELPDLDGQLISTADGISWFLLQNNMSNLQDTLGRLEDAGFTVSAYEDVGLTIDSKAASWLLIVQTAS